MMMTGPQTSRPLSQKATSHSHCPLQQSPPEISALTALDLLCLRAYAKMKTFLMNSFHWKCGTTTLPLSTERF